MNNKNFPFIFFFITTLGIVFSIFVSPVYADWEGWCAFGVGPGCHEHPHTSPLSLADNNTDVTINLENSFAVELSPARAKPGEIVKIVGWQGFQNNTRANIYFDATRLKSSLLSSDYPEIKIPLTVINGLHTVTLTAFDGLGASIKGVIEIYDAKDKLEQQIILNPDTALAGNRVMILGKDWVKGDKKIMMTKLDGTEITLTDIRNICVETLGGNGCEDGEIRYSIVAPTDTPAGDYAVMVFGSDDQKAGQQLHILTTEKIIREKAEVVLHPASGPPGTIVSVSGGGFPRKAGIFAKFDAEKIAIGNGFGITVDDEGSFITSFSVPFTAKPGKHPVTFTTGTLEGNTFAIFTVDGEQKIENKKEVEEEIKKENEKVEILKTKYDIDISEKKYTDIETKKYNDVDSKTYTDIQTKDFKDINIKSYGEVEAPSFKEPANTSDDCNSNVPMYSQPEKCREQSLNELREANTASIFTAFRNAFKWLRPKAKKAPPSITSTENNDSNTIVSSKQEKSDVLTPDESKSSVKTSEIKNKNKDSNLSGSYRCFSYNVSGGGSGNCRSFAPIVLQANGNYSMSSEKGTYKVSGDTIILSESKLRGAGKLLENNLQIRFEYDYNGWHHVLTYLKENTDSVEKKPSSAPVQKNIEVTLRIAFPDGDYSADSVNSMTLVKEENGEQIAQALPYPIDRQTIEAWFSKRPPKEGVLTGYVYKIMVGSGFGSDWQVGMLDLRNITKDTTITINATPQ